MNNKSIVFTVIEYDCLTVDSVDNPINHTISSRTFNELLEFCASCDEASSFITIGYYKSKPRIYFKKYVGSFMTKSGIIFEILPKIYRNNDDKHLSRSIVLYMLRKCYGIKYKKGVSYIDNEKMPIFEIYIKLFIDEVNKLLKRGLRRSYNLIQENSNALKGKMLFAKHISANFVHREWFYTEHDDYNLNTSENKIIKAALLKAKTLTSNIDNYRELKRTLLFFELIENSTNLQKDLSLCSSNKLLNDYSKPLEYAQTLLSGYGFSIYGTEHFTISLLFSMHDLYEIYIYEHIKDLLEEYGYEVISQPHDYKLFSNPMMFELKPDILLKKNNITYILDTKWKILNNDVKGNYGIKSGDMYQMYVYARRYKNVKKVILLYPKAYLDKELSFVSEDNVKVETRQILLPVEENYEQFAGLIMDAL